jgi:hypothetical protein
MNIFYLDRVPSEAAKMHCDKHVVKMIIEYAQLMSTAHRVLDGEMYYDLTANGRKIKRWKLQGKREELLYKASHVNHPSNIWTRQSNNNYMWLYCLFCALCEEYSYRYGKVHETDRKLRDVLKTPPNMIEIGYKTQPPQAMPDDAKVNGDSIVAYKNYYIKYKKDFAKWTRRDMPLWFNQESVLT